jgi:hypothetical protein
MLIVGLFGALAFLLASGEIVRRILLAVAE